MLLPQLKEVFQPSPPPEVVQCLIEVSRPLCEVIVAGGWIILLIVIAKRQVRTRCPHNKCDGVSGSSKSSDNRYDRGLEFTVISASTTEVNSLPDLRVSEQWPFSYTGVDFAGPLYARDTVGSPARKAWLCLYTCCSTRAVHLDVIPDMTAEAFLPCFRRFSGRRGFPRKMVSDNAKTIKAAAKALAAIVESSTVTRYLSNVGVRSLFNVARAPWWGGVFERMIQTVKRRYRECPIDL